MSDFVLSESPNCVSSVFSQPQTIMSVKMHFVVKVIFSSAMLAW